MADLSRLSEIMGSLIEEMIKDNPDESLDLNKNYELRFKFKFASDGEKVAGIVSKAQLVKL